MQVGIEQEELLHGSTVSAVLEGDVAILDLAKQSCHSPERTKDRQVVKRDVKC